MNKIAKRRLVVVGLWLLTLLLGAWAISAVPAADLVSKFSQLGGAQVAALLVVNALIAWSFGWRWWMILRSQGYKIPYPALASYRLMAFSISYFTPGPHVGGEPLQAYLLRRRHGVPGPVAVSSVALDKLIEVLTNLSFLLLGIAITLQTQLPVAVSAPAAIGFGLILVAIPVMIITLWVRGASPISGILGKVLPASWRLNSKLYGLIEASERRAAHLCQSQPNILLRGLGVSVLIWLALLGEYWLAAHWLGIDLSPAQLIAAMTAARIAILLPLPGGLGSLDASQVFVLTALGYSAAAGFSLSLLIHLRDILFGLLGLWWGSTIAGGWHTLWSAQETYD
jgi:glycosyltransferase 2 family protein